MQYFYAYPKHRKVMDQVWELLVDSSPGFGVRYEERRWAILISTRFKILLSTVKKDQWLKVFFIDEYKSNIMTIWLTESSKYELNLPWTNPEHRIELKWHGKRYKKLVKKRCKQINLKYLNNSSKMYLTVELTEKL